MYSSTAPLRATPGRCASRGRGGVDTNKAERATLGFQRRSRWPQPSAGGHGSAGLGAGGLSRGSDSRRLHSPIEVGLRCRGGLTIPVRSPPPLLRRHDDFDRIIFLQEPKRPTPAKPASAAGLADYFVADG